MVSCLTISYKCLPCLPRGRVNHCVPGFTNLGTCLHFRKWVWSLRKKFVAWPQGSKMLVGSWWGGKGERGVRWEGGGFLVLFKCGEHRVSSGFYLFVSDINHGKKGMSWRFFCILPHKKTSRDLTEN